MESGSRDVPCIEIDGSVLEGGGQILRIATALATLHQEPIRIKKIRAGRKTPGLSNQHLQGLGLVKNISHGLLEGARLGSEDISFTPGKIASGNYIGDSVTAGSVTLLLQIALPCALFADGPITLTLRGGTNADFAPPVDYLQHVLLPILHRFGIKTDLSILRRGYYPRGGGEIVVKVTPIQFIFPIVLEERGVVEKICMYSYVAGQLSDKVAEECADLAENILKQNVLSPEVKFRRIVKREKEADAVGTGSGIFLWAETSKHCILAGNSNGSKQQKSPAVASEAANMLIRAIKSEACVDEHLEDQLIIFMALAKGHSKILTGPLTLHTQTAIYVCENMLSIKFSVTELPNGNNWIECDGVAFENRNFAK